MHSENPKISNFHWVTKPNFGGVPNFERSRKNPHVDQRFTPTAVATSPRRRANRQSRRERRGLGSSGCGSWLSMDGGHGALGTPARADFSPKKSRAPCVWASRAPRRYSEGLRQGGLLQSEVGKNINRLSVGKDCHGVITVVRHWLVNGSCGCDRNRAQDQSSGQDARNFRNHNDSPLVSGCPSPRVQIVRSESWSNQEFATERSQLIKHTDRQPLIPDSLAPEMSGLLRGEWRVGHCCLP
jgi:hypothetical protein